MGVDFMTQTMGIFDQLQYWKETNTIVEMHYIVAGVKRTIYGRVLSFESSAQKIIFYNDDAKNTENISLAQIEDVIVPQPPSQTEPAQTMPGYSHKEKQAQGVQPASKKSLSVKEELIEAIETLSTPDLYALLPLVKQLSKHAASRSR
jgi:hypothetical protein